MKTAELTGAALDWAVAVVFNPGHEWGEWKPSSDWSQGGPIIERERIELRDAGGDGWAADDNLHATQYGTTPLIAAMRCYVASKLGEEVQIPDELN